MDTYLKGTCELESGRLIKLIRYSLFPNILIISVFLSCHMRFRVNLHFAQNRRDIWILSDCKRIRTQNPTGCGFRFESCWSHLILILICNLHWDKATWKKKIIRMMFIKKWLYHFLFLIVHWCYWGFTICICHKEVKQKSLFFLSKLQDFPNKKVLTSYYFSFLLFGITFPRYYLYDYVLFGFWG